MLVREGLGDRGAKTGGMVTLRQRIGSSFLVGKPDCKYENELTMGYKGDHEYQQFGSMKVGHFHSYFAKQSKLGYRGTWFRSELLPPQKQRVKITISEYHSAYLRYCVSPVLHQKD
jgi:hypothetical protein